MVTTKCKCPFIYGYIESVKTGTVLVGQDIKKAAALVEKKLAEPDVRIETSMTAKAVELIERYFDFKLLDWELFVLGLVHCYYDSTDTVVFREFLILMGRGNGKNGFISALVWYLTTHYHGVKGYNVDIIANSEEQAKTSFDDVYEVLENHWPKLKHFFYKSKQIIKNLKTNSYIRFNTSNSKTSDGKRSACLVFDELHEYENDKNIKVFSSGFGKRKHSRKFKITSHGYVREGVLDEELRLAKDILNGIITELDVLPLLYWIEKEEEALDPAMWYKANPSLKYLPVLQQEMNSAFVEMKYKPGVKQDFYTKRLGWPMVDKETAVTSWENLEKASDPVPVSFLKGQSCVCGIDYAMLSDMASVGLWFRVGDQRYWIQHTWISRQSKDWDFIRAPLEEWEAQGALTVVKDVQIDPTLLTDWIKEQQTIYNIVEVSLDGARLALMREALADIGFSKEDKNIWIVRPLGIVSVTPVFDYLFDKHLIAFGDLPLVRWAINNTKKTPTRNVGNYIYEKIEPKSRKTDPFMAMVHAGIRDEQLLEFDPGDAGDLPCFVF